MRSQAQQILLWRRILSNCRSHPSQLTLSRSLNHVHQYDTHRFRQGVVGTVRPRLVLQQQQPQRNNYSSTGSSPRSAPRFRVPAHVAAFSVILVPALAIYAYYERFGGKDEEGLERELRQRYAAEIRDASAKNQHMAEFFQKTVFRPTDDKGGTLDPKLDQVLKGGKGEVKRLHAVDERLYGTAEGAAEKQRMEEKLQSAKKKKKKRKKKDSEVTEAAGSTDALSLTTKIENAEEQQASKETSDHKNKKERSRTKKRKTKINSSPDTEASSTSTASSSSSGALLDAKTITTFAAVATIAAAIGFVAGGGSRRP